MSRKGKNSQLPKYQNLQKSGLWYIIIGIMKLITLNTWGGKAGKEKLLGFFEKYKDIDIFCLQEMWSAPHDFGKRQAGGVDLNYEQIMTRGVQEIAGVLPLHTSYFHPHVSDNFGLQMLVKKDLRVVEDGDIFVYKHKGHMSEEDLGNHARNIQYVTLETASGLVTAINFHGLWNGQGKGDSEDRVNQSKNILNFVSGLSNDFILCGDFNLLPDTKSLKMIEEHGLRDLIKEYGITSTRTSFYTKTERYADYIFTTKGISIKEFKVLPEEVSDHSALLLEFN